MFFAVFVVVHACSCRSLTGLCTHYRLWQLQVELYKSLQRHCQKKIKPRVQPSFGYIAPVDDKGCLCIER